MPVYKIVTINILVSDESTDEDIADKVKFAINNSCNCTSSFTVEQINAANHSEQPTIDGFVEYLNDYIAEELTRGTSFIDACTQLVFEDAADAYLGGAR